MRTKIIATIGPSSDNPAILKQFVGLGVDIFRMNFSHCTHEEYRRRSAVIRAEAKRLKKRVSIMQDLKGPRLRVGTLPAAGIRIRHDDEVIFTTNGGAKKKAIHIDDPYLHSDIRVGEPIFLANGLMEMVVTKVEGEYISARVIRGGRLFSNKAVNVPHTILTTSGLTTKDIEDVKFAIKAGVDYIALSFVQSAADVEQLRALVPKKIKIIAKIERGVTLKHIDEIILAADGIMVARGDLGTEMPMEKVPFVQKNLIRHAAWHGKPSITATQMLYSMVDHQNPTRAEVSDVANAVLDGTDAVMLSDESASGQYPLEAVMMLQRIVRETEGYHYDKPNTL